MAMNSEHATVILKRVFDCQDPSEQIELVSGKDKQRTWIHRVILSAASKYFAGLLGSNFQGEKPKEFVLDDSDGGTLKAVVKFCYTGNIDLTEENVDKYLAIALSAEIDLLLQKCRQFLSAKLSVANAVDILMIADKYRIGDLRVRAIKSICARFEAVSSLDIQKLSHRLLQDLLTCDEIQEYGDLCAQRLLEWFRCDEDERGVHMPALLKLIRLEQVTLEFLNETLEAVFIRFKYSDLMYAEFKRRLTSQCVSKRALSQCVSNSVSRMRSIFLVPKNKSSGQLEMKKYNIVSGCFEKVQANLSKSRSHSNYGVVIYESKMFVMGGKNLCSIFSYDLKSGKVQSLTKMKGRRAHFSTISTEDYIYVIGGSNVGTPVDLCERFDMKNNTWSSLKSMNDARYSASATVLNGYIYVAGGREKSGWPTCSVEFYDPNIDEWRSRSPMNRGRHEFGLAELNGFLYAMGDDKVIERFDPNLNEWTQLGSFAGSDLISSAIAIDGKLFIIKYTGEFGRVEVDQSGKCSFISLHRCGSDYSNCYLLLSD